MRIWIALLAALGAQAPARAADPPALTIEQARSLPLDDLVDIVMRQLGANIREVTRPNYDSPLEPGLPLNHLTFATAPHSSGFGGLCAATAIHVSFYDGSAPHEPGRNVPRRARAIQTVERYKVIGDVELSYNLGAERRPQQEAQCARLVQVIPPGDEHIAQRAFFTFDGELRPAVAAHVLQRLLRDTRSGVHTDHGCGQSVERCTDPAAWLRALSLDDLLSVRVERLSDADRYKIIGTFRIGGSGNALTMDTVTVEATYRGDRAAVTQLGPVTIGRGTLIRD
ncbi:MAG TPA: hypothetical protein VGB79_16950 [Allosphingosinicella sp.]|jgi:hypothetical protein